MRRLKRKRSHPLPWWYKAIRDACTQYGFKFQKQFQEGGSGKIDLREAWINGVRVRLAFTGAHRTSRRGTARGSSARIRHHINVGEYSCMILVRRIVRWRSPSVLSFYVIPARLLKKTQRIKIPVHAGSSLWNQFLNNWNCLPAQPPMPPRR